VDPGSRRDLPGALYAKWIEAYHAEHPNVSLSYEAVGSGEGISRFVTGSVDFGASDAALTDVQAAKVAGGVITIPATAGMVVLAYNLPAVTGTLRLPRDVYTEIFVGTLKRWDDPRITAADPGATLPHRDIVIVARQDSSGTTRSVPCCRAARSPFPTVNAVARNRASCDKRSAPTRRKRSKTVRAHPHR
jgi:phosphate transport system substrate-binding protein